MKSSSPNQSPSVTILVADKVHDVAELLFESGSENIPYLSLGSSAGAVEGERVLVIGNPNGLTGTVSDGIIAAFRKKRSIIQITAPISPGSSGSPVINAESGEVIGIAKGFDEEGQNLNFAISADAVKVVIAKGWSKQELADQKQINRAADQNGSSDNPIKVGPRLGTATTPEESFWHSEAPFGLVALALGLICWAYARLRKLMSELPVSLLK
jgi:hypothetical protein